MKKEVKTAKKSPATGKNTVAGKTGANAKPMRVWQLTSEDINEWETDVAVYRSEASAKAAMEEGISLLADDDSVIEREDALHATLDHRFTWAIKKIKVP